MARPGLTSSSPPSVSDPARSVFSVLLLLPRTWETAVERTARELAADVPPALRAALLQPHITLCQPFRAPVTHDLGVVLAAIERALAAVRPSAIRMGGVSCFASTDGTSEFIHLQVEGTWLRAVNELLVLGTAPFRAAAPASERPVGNPAHDLAGYTPHVTLLAVSRTARHQAEIEGWLARAAALWAANRPHEAIFMPEQAQLSATTLSWWHGTEPELEVEPYPVHTWQLSAAHGMDRGSTRR